MKSVLISIQPKWCELIASGKKTVEVRKTKPKLETPFKVYIYCTKGEMVYLPKDIFGDEALNGKVIGEFVCEDITDIHYHEAADGYGVAMSHPLCDFFAESTCLKYEELHKYLQGNNGYGWHISDLVIYDKPKELNEFQSVSNYARKLRTEFFGKDPCCVNDYKLTRPPQSWCYCEELLPPLVEPKGKTITIPKWTYEEHKGE